MPLEIIIARWFAVGCLVFGLSHLLFPAKWADLMLPLRERENGGLLLGLFNLPVGLVVVLGHNLWAWGLPLIVTVVGWGMTLKGAIYLLLPRSLAHVMPERERMTKALRVGGAVMIVLGALVAYDSFCLR